MYTVVTNLTPPERKTVRTRTRGPFGIQLDALNVGEGFEFDDTRSLKALYPVVAPARFGGFKRFQVWAVEGQANHYAVVRLADYTEAEVAIRAAVGERLKAARAAKAKA